jgi:hypothetical protein
LELKMPASVSICVICGSEFGVWSSGFLTPEFCILSSV